MSANYPFLSWEDKSPKDESAIWNIYVEPPPEPTKPIKYIEIDQDLCEHTYGVSPCTATGAAANKCFNTKKSCQDLDNYSLGTPLTLRFVVPNQEMDFDVYAIPIVQSASTTSSRANIGGRSSRDKALGRRGTFAFTMLDAPHSDVLVDPYLSDRDYNPLERAGFVSKWLARNYYTGRPCRIKEGYVGQAVGDMQTRHYVLDKVDLPGSGGTATFKALDVLSLADDDKGQAPAASRGELYNITPAGNINISGALVTDYPAPGYVRIGNEVIYYDSSSAAGQFIQLSGVDRAVVNTEQEEHSFGDTVQLCLYYETQRPIDVIRDLLENYSNVPSTFVPFADWETEANAWAEGQTVTRIITEPIGVAQLVGEIDEQCGLFIWWDERAQEIKLKYMRPVAADETIRNINEQDHIIQNTVSNNVRPEERASQVWISFLRRSAVSTTNSRDGYTRHRLHVDLDAQSAAEYGQTRVYELYSPWIVANAEAAILANRALARYRDDPRYITFHVDAKDRDISVGDVIRLYWRGKVDVFGEVRATLYQVISVSEVVSGEEIKCEAQVYEFIYRYGGFVEELDSVTGKTWADSDSAERAAYDEDMSLTRSNYDTATQAERDKWLYFAQDVCPLSFGIAPCTASGTPCENSWSTCLDRDNYEEDASSATVGTDEDEPYRWI